MTSAPEFAPKLSSKLLTHVQFISVLRKFHPTIFNWLNIRICIQCWQLVPTGIASSYAPHQTHRLTSELSRMAEATVEGFCMFARVNRRVDKNQVQLLIIEKPIVDEFEENFGKKRGVLQRILQQEVAEEEPSKKRQKIAEASEPSKEPEPKVPADLQECKDPKDLKEPKEPKEPQKPSKPLKPPSSPSPVPSKEAPPHHVISSSSSVSVIEQSPRALSEFPSPVSQIEMARNPQSEKSFSDDEIMIVDEKNGPRKIIKSSPNAKVLNGSPPCQIKKQPARVVSNSGGSSSRSNKVGKSKKGKLEEKVDEFINRSIVDQIIQVENEKKAQNQSLLEEEEVQQPVEREASKPGSESSNSSSSEKNSSRSAASPPSEENPKVVPEDPFGDEENDEEEKPVPIAENNGIPLLEANGDNPADYYFGFLRMHQAASSDPANFEAWTQYANAYFGQVHSLVQADPKKHEIFINYVQSSNPPVFDLLFPDGFQTTESPKQEDLSASLEAVLEEKIDSLQEHFEKAIDKIGSRIDSEKSAFQKQTYRIYELQKQLKKIEEQGELGGKKKEKTYSTVKKILSDQHKFEARIGRMEKQVREANAQSEETRDLLKTMNENLQALIRSFRTDQQERQLQQQQQSSFLPMVMPRQQKQSQTPLTRRQAAMSEMQGGTLNVSNGLSRESNLNVSNGLRQEGHLNVSNGLVQNSLNINNDLPDNGTISSSYSSRRKCGSLIISNHVGESPSGRSCISQPPAEEERECSSPEIVESIIPKRVEKLSRKIQAAEQARRQQLEAFESSRHSSCVVQEPETTIELPPPSVEAHKPPQRPPTIINSSQLINTLRHPLPNPTPVNDNRESLVEVEFEHPEPDLVAFGEISPILEAAKVGQQQQPESPEGLQNPFEEAAAEASFLEPLPEGEGNSKLSQMTFAPFGSLADPHSQPDETSPPQIPTSPPLMSIAEQEEEEERQNLQEAANDPEEQANCQNEKAKEATVLWGDELEDANPGMIDQEDTIPLPLRSPSKKVASEQQEVVDEKERKVGSDGGPGQPAPSEASQANSASPRQPLPGSEQPSPEQEDPAAGGSFPQDGSPYAEMAYLSNQHLSEDTLAPLQDNCAEDETPFGIELDSLLKMPLPDEAQEDEQTLSQFGHVEDDPITAALLLPQDLDFPVNMQAAFPSVHFGQELSSKRNQTRLEKQAAVSEGAKSMVSAVDALAENDAAIYSQGESMGDRESAES